MLSKKSLALGAAVVGVAVLFLYASTAEAPGPAPTEARTAMPAAAASPSATQAATTDHGYVFFADPDRIEVRRERDGAIAFTLGGIEPAVSADGKRLAYWRRSPDARDRRDLRVLDVADPTSERSVLILPNDTIGGSIVWSNDGQGLLIETHSVEGSGPFGAPTRYDLVMVDLAATPPATRPAAAQVSMGEVYRPVAWDRPGRIAAAVVTGEGGAVSAYVTWNGNAASPFARTVVRSPATLIAYRVQASADAKFVMGPEYYDFNALRIWPLADITKAETMRSATRIHSAAWRPGPTAPYEVIWAVGERVELIRYPTSSSTTLYTGTDELAGVAVRPDGSAVLVMHNTGRILVVDVATRQTLHIWTPLPGLRPLSRGVLLR